MMENIYCNNSFRSDSRVSSVDHSEASRAETMWSRVVKEPKAPFEIKDKLVQENVEIIRLGALTAK